VVDRQRSNEESVHDQPRVEKGEQEDLPRPAGDREEQL
jgi:hypothetical protein